MQIRDYLLKTGCYTRLKKNLLKEVHAHFAHLYGYNL